jgi:hypothetical protein
MGAAALVLSRWIGAAHATGGLALKASEALIPVAVGSVVYVGLAFLLRSPELQMVLSMVPGRRAA